MRQAFEEFPFDEGAIDVDLGEMKGVGVMGNDQFGAERIDGTLGMEKLFGGGGTDVALVVIGVHQQRPLPEKRGKFSEVLVG